MIETKIKGKIKGYNKVAKWDFKAEEGSDKKDIERTFDFIQAIFSANDVKEITEIKMVRKPNELRIS